MQRRSCRRFKQEPVERERLEKLLEAGRMAPSGANLQPLEFIAVDDAELSGQIYEQTMWAGYLPEWEPAPGERPTAWIAVVHNEQVSSDYGQDVGFAAESITLVAEDEGLASCCIGSFQSQAVEELLGIPETHSVALLIGLGVRGEEARAVVAEGGNIRYYRDENEVHYVPKRPREEVTHWNGY
jgi:nitroreductase